MTEEQVDPDYVNDDNIEDDDASDDDEDYVSISDASDDMDENDDVTVLNNEQDSSHDPVNNDVTVEPSDTSVDNGQARYPRRERRSSGRWYIASTARSVDVRVSTSDDPTLKEAMSSTSEERNLWIAAIEEEFKSLKENNTWVLDPNPKAQPLPTHVRLKIKRESDGAVERFKARLVVGGNIQIFGVNYLETYAPVVSFVIVRIFIRVRSFKQENEKGTYRCENGFSQRDIGYRHLDHVSRRNRWPPFSLLQTKQRSVWSEASTSRLAQKAV